MAKAPMVYTMQKIDALNEFCKQFDKAKSREIKCDIIHQACTVCREDLMAALQHDKDNGWPRPLVRAFARMLQSI